MSQLIDNLCFKTIEPLFGTGVGVVVVFIWNLKTPHLQHAEKLRKTLVEKFGNNGGFLMEFICGNMSLNEYVMRCRLAGQDDFYLYLLEEIYNFYETIRRPTPKFMLPSKKEECVELRMKTLRQDLQKLRILYNDCL